MPAHKWQFAPRFRRKAFGWRSDTPIQRIRQAVSEIKAIAKKEPVLAAEGVVIFLEKLSPALEQVDSSSGAIGSAVNSAIDTLVPFVTRADVDQKTRQRWLERLWKAVEDDGMSYIEGLGEYWGQLCSDPALASHWAEKFLPKVEKVWSPSAPGHGYSKGIPSCLASLLAAGRNEELLALLEQARSKWWHYRQWGVKALVAMGKKTEAVQYADESRGLNNPGWQIAETCEAILLSSGLLDAAYERYAVEANQGSTHLATFRAIAKKYPHKTAAHILHDLVASTSGEDGKWFAAAKNAGLFDQAIALVSHSPADPRTLTRAAKDFADKQPAFALASGLAALRWIARGHGYDITGSEVLEAYAAALFAGRRAGVDVLQVNTQVRELLAGDDPSSRFAWSVIGPMAQ